MAGKPAAKKGMGFAAAAKKVEAQGKSPAAAKAIIAAGARNASPAAKAANPNLKKVAAKKPVPKKVPSKGKGGGYGK